MENDLEKQIEEERIRIEELRAVWNQKKERAKRVEFQYNDVRVALTRHAADLMEAQNDADRVQDAIYRATLALGKAEAELRDKPKPALSSPEGVQVCSIQTGETSEPSLRNQPEPDAALCHCLVHCRGGVIPDGVRCRELPISPEAASWITGEPSTDQLRTTYQSSEPVMNEQTPLPEEVTGERGEAPSESAGEDFTLTATSASSGSETLTTGLAGLSNEASDQTSNSPKHLCEAE